MCLNKLTCFATQKIQVVNLFALSAVQKPFEILVEFYLHHKKMLCQKIASVLAARVDRDETQMLVATKRCKHHAGLATKLICCVGMVLSTSRLKKAETRSQSKPYDFLCLLRVHLYLLLTASWNQPA